jgi:hypothetical protein
MKGKKEEAEAIVRFDQLEQAVYVCVSSWPAMYRKMCRLYGPSLDGASPEHSARWKLPLKSVRFRSLSSLTKATGRPFEAQKRRVEGQFESAAL